jgi:sugar O-acyltransferase (sialic acid O-acetyltransferase NeuD family)
MIELVFLGGSNSYLEIIELINDINITKAKSCKYKVVAILDDNIKLWGTYIQGIEIKGELQLVNNYPKAKFIFGIGSVKNRFTREKIIERLNIPICRFETLVHPNAKVYSTAQIGHGCTIHSGTTICHGAIINPFVIVTFNSVIGNFTLVDCFSMITTGVTILNNVIIEKNVFIGSCSCVADGLCIGRGAIIGMGTVLARNVLPGSYVIGNPARTLYTTKNN